MDGRRAGQQRRQGAEQAGAVLPQAHHVEGAGAQHGRQARHAIVHRRRQLLQQPAQAAVRHGLVGHRNRGQLVDLRDRNPRLDQHRQEEVQALLLGGTGRLGVLFDQHFDFLGLQRRIGHPGFGFVRHAGQLSGQARQLALGPAGPQAARHQGDRHRFLGRIFRDLSMAEVQDRVLHRHDPDVFARQRALGLQALVKGVVAGQAIGQLRRLAARRQVLGHGRDHVKRVRQQAALAQALGELDADVAVRMLQDQPAEQLVRLLMRADVAEQLGAGEQPGGVVRGLWQMPLDQGKRFLDVAFLDQARRAITHDFQVIGAFAQQRGPLFGHPFVQARRLLQSQQQEADLGIGHVAARQRLRVGQVGLRHLDPPRCRHDFLQPRLDRLQVRRRGALALGDQGRIHAAFLRLALSIHTSQRSM